MKRTVSGMPKQKPYIKAKSTEPKSEEEKVDAYLQSANRGVSGNYGHIQLQDIDIAINLVKHLIHQKMNDPHHRFLSIGETCDCTKDLQFIEETLVTQRDNN